ncbi:MAG: metal ABC transporter ATP-binding protein [Pseudomonadota bacterium]
MVPIACETQDLSVAYREDLVLKHVDFRVPSGSVMGIVGPNGAGKSTLIKAMLGLVAPLAGTSKFFGRPLDAVRSRVGYMPQAASVDWDFPTTVIDLVTMGTYGRLGWFRRPAKRERMQAMAALEQTGMHALATRQIGELSGGQRQRVFLARALVQAPDLYFMDEPFQGIDAKSQQAIIDVLKRLSAQGKTIVIVHHHLASVLDICDHVTLLNKSVVASGPGRDVFTAENIRVAYEAGTGAEAFLAQAG